jgi:hypothetical protein
MILLLKKKSTTMIPLLCFVLLLFLVLMYSSVKKELTHRFPLMTQEKVDQHYLLLSRFQQFCQEAQVLWFPVGGTLLGALRNGAFIPWDNDVDVGMMEDEVQRLLATPSKKELLEKHRLILSPYSKDPLKVFLIEDGNDDEVSHSRPCLDIFEYTVVDKDTINFKSDHARRMWPKEYYLVSELAHTREYKFGPLIIRGPWGPEMAERQWGKNWRIPRVKWMYQWLHGAEIQKMTMVSPTSD